MNNSPIEPRVLIYTGGRLGPWAIDLPAEHDILIGADHGAAFLIHHGYHPALSIGDFDSVSEDELDDIRLHSLAMETCDPVMKDYSDTEMAFRRAVEMKPVEIVIVGALGSRFDHTLANVHLLIQALRLRIPCRLLDENNEIRLTDSVLEVDNPDRRYSYVSLLPLTLEVTGVTLTGFQYPLQEAAIELGQSLAVSNILTGDRGIVQVSSGMLLVIQSKD